MPPPDKFSAIPARMRLAEGVRVADGVIVGLVDVEGRVNADAGMIFAETAVILGLTDCAMSTHLILGVTSSPENVNDGVSVDGQLSFEKISALNVVELAAVKRAYILELEEYTGLVPRAAKRVRLKPAADAGESIVQAVAPSKTEWLKKKPLSFGVHVPAEYSTPVWYSDAPEGRSHSSTVLKILANTGAPKVPKPGMDAHAPAARLKATGAREAEHVGGALTATLLSDGQNWKLAPEARLHAGPT
jgi:hypothetical protein